MLELKRLLVLYQTDSRRSYLIHFCTENCACAGAICLDVYGRGELQNIWNFSIHLVQAHLRLDCTFCNMENIKEMM